MRFLNRAAAVADPREDDLVLDDGAPRLNLEGGEIAMGDHARHWIDLIAARAMQVIMVPIRKLEPGAAIIEHHLADDAVRHEPLRRAKNRGKVRARAASGETDVDIFKRPRVTSAPLYHIRHRGGNPCLARHISSLGRQEQ
jgi:hypothetical protein